MDCPPQPVSQKESFLHFVVPVGHSVTAIGKDVNRAERRGGARAPWQYRLPHREQGFIVQEYDTAQMAWFVDVPVFVSPGSRTIQETVLILLHNFAIYPLYFLRQGFIQPRLALNLQCRQRRL